MDKKDIQAWQQEKAKELFAYSHKLLDAAKDLSAHHLEEIQWGMKNAMESAKSAAKNDLTKLKELQESATKELRTFSKCFSVPSAASSPISLRTDFTFF